jgi:ABC-2 type transport system permease protein
MKTKRNSFAGLSVVLFKEAGDFAGGIRMIILTFLIILTTAFSMYAAGTTIRDFVGQDMFLLLSLFTLSTKSFPSFLSFMTFLVPLAGIAIGFDVINSEFQNRTLARVLSQPIHKDTLLIGKALGALVALGIVLLALWLAVIGFAILFLGLQLSTEQTLRALAFYFVTLFYGMFWFLTAMLFSIVFRQGATSALVSIGFWLFITIFWPMITEIIANSIGSYDAFLTAKIGTIVGRISPTTLYTEIAVALLSPTTRSLGVVLFSQLEGAVMGSALPFGQSLLLSWPHITALLSLTILLFTLSYVLFQRKEIRG